MAADTKSNKERYEEADQNALFTRDSGTNTDFSKPISRKKERTEQRRAVWKPLAQPKPKPKVRRWGR